jgi:hypothetical protein
MNDKVLWSLLLFCCLSIKIIASESSIGLSLPVITEKNPEYIVQEQIKIMEDFIEATETSLQNQKELLQLLRKYQLAQQNYYKNSDNDENLYQMVKIGHRLNQSIKKAHLNQIFDGDFLRDLNVFSQVGQKRAIPKP